MAKLFKQGTEFILKDVNLPLMAQLGLDNGEVLSVDIRLVDSRKMSDEQRRFIFLLCGAYGYETGLNSEEFRAIVMQTAYDSKLVESTSLRQYTMSEANRLITLMISILIDKDIPISKDLLEKNEYQYSEQQTYMLCLKRRCLICGKRAELHHVDAVGMGRNRNKISHLGMRMLPLCREHLSLAHNIGNKRLIEEYHLVPCVVDEKLEHFIKKGVIKVFEERSQDGD